MRTRSRVGLLSAAKDSIKAKNFQYNSESFAFTSFVMNLCFEKRLSSLRAIVFQYVIGEFDDNLSRFIQFVFESRFKVNVTALLNMLLAYA